MTGHPKLLRHGKATSLFPAIASLSLWFANFPEAPAQEPRGVFSLKGAGGHALPGAYQNPDVAGLSIRQDWAELEPNEGDFHFDYLEGEIKKATDNGKTAFIRVNTQAGKPAWVTQSVQNAGGTFFTFDDNGILTTIPVFWDPTFLAKKKAMIAALGAHFADYPSPQNRTVQIVSVSFANATSEDWNVPHEEEEVLDWLAAGYTTEKLVDAGQQLIDATIEAFPNQFVALSIGGNGHSEDRANLDATATEVVAATIAMTASKWPGRLLVQMNSLSTFNPDPPGEADTPWNSLWNSQPSVGAQMLFNVWSDPGCRVNQGNCDPGPEAILTTAIDRGIGYRINYVEIYEIDVRNLPGVITHAHDQLAPTPTPAPIPTPVPFQLDGQPDALGYVQSPDGMTLYAAVRGGLLYLATASPGDDGSQPNDHFIFVTDQLLPAAIATPPWNKTGFVASDLTKPFLAGESASTLCGWFNGGVSARATKSADGSGLMEGTLDLAAAFGSIPDTVFAAAAAYSTADGGGLVAQVPFGDGNGNIDPDEFLPLSIAALRDENADGVYDRLDPALGFSLQITRAGNITTLTWTSVPGRTYQAQRTDDLTSVQWTALNGAITAGPNQLSLTTSDTTALPARFYRIQLLNP